MVSVWLAVNDMNSSVAPPAFRDALGAIVDALVTRTDAKVFVGNVPDIRGVRERWGRDLLHCPYCHGYEVRDQPLGVLGGDPAFIEDALAQWRFVPYSVNEQPAEAETDLSFVFKPTGDGSTLPGGGRP